MRRLGILAMGMALNASAALAQQQPCDPSTVVDRVNVDISIRAGEFQQDNLSWWIGGNGRAFSHDGAAKAYRWWYDLESAGPRAKAPRSQLQLIIYKAGWTFDKEDADTWERVDGRCEVTLKRSAWENWNIRVSTSPSARPVNITCPLGKCTDQPTVIEKITELPRSATLNFVATIPLLGAGKNPRVFPPCQVVMQLKGTDSGPKGLTAEQIRADRAFAPGGDCMRFAAITDRFPGIPSGGIIVTTIAPELPR